MHPSTFTIAMIAAAVLVVIGVAYFLVGWMGKRSGRVLLRGLGFAVGVVGLMVIGWMELAVKGVEAVIDWARATPMTVRIEIGLVLLCLGVVAFVVGTFMHPILGEEAKRRHAELVDKRAARAGLPPKTKAGTTPSSLPASSLPAGAPRPAAPAAGDAADDEIDAILRRHGIQ